MEVEIETERFPEFISKNNLANWEVAELKNMGPLVKLNQIVFYHVLELDNELL